MISARLGSPKRAGRVADISTPIIVARAVSRRRTRVSGSAARRIACQASARSSIEAHMSAKATSTQIGVAATIARPVDSIPMRCTARAASAAPPTTPVAASPRRSARLARGRLGDDVSLGSSEGRRRGGTRGPDSAGLAPTRAARRARADSGRGCARASS